MPLILIFNVIVAYFLWDAHSRIPKQHRAIDPLFSWLTVIPFVGLVFSWILLPFKLPDSLRSYFQDKPDLFPDSDYGRALGLWAMASNTSLYLFAVIPFIGLIMVVIAIVLIVLYLKQLRKFTEALPPRAQQMQSVGSNADHVVNLEASISEEKRESKYAELSRLKQLLDDGTLSQEEFDAEKKKVLGRD